MGPRSWRSSTRSAEVSARQARETLSPRRVALPAMDAQAGFALIEVLISAVMLALIVIATFNGFDIADHASADQRARAQADVIAQQDEDHLRSKQIDQISTLNETHPPIKMDGTEYTLVSTGEFIADTTGATTCDSTSAQASYVRTTSTVTWPGAGTRDPVVETGLIAPPPGGTLLVEITNAKGLPVSGMTVEAIGPSPATSMVTGTTGVKGCVIFSGLEEGEYRATAFQTGYINNKSFTSEPPVSEQSVTISAGTTEKKPFGFDRPGAIAVTFTPSTLGEKAESDTFVAQNTGLPTPGFVTFGKVGTYAATVTSSQTLYPFEGAYAVYAGTCEADEPTNFGASNGSANLLANETASSTVLLPAVNMQVFGGTTSSSEKVTEFSGTFKDEGTGCGGMLHPFSTTIATNGELHKGMSFGKFTLCIASINKVGSPAEYRKLASTPGENKSASGTSTYAIYLGSGEHRTTSAYTCP
jgi:Tfp pilus assembly protein PilV